MKRGSNGRKDFLKGPLIQITHEHRIVAQIGDSKRRAIELESDAW